MWKAFGLVAIRKLTMSVLRFLELLMLSEKIQSSFLAMGLKACNCL
jgi:hypothetical protein